MTYWWDKDCLLALAWLGSCVNGQGIDEPADGLVFEGAESEAVRKGRKRGKEGKEGGIK